MKMIAPRLLLFCLLVSALAAGCRREDKFTGPAPVLPEGGVTLMFADCDPFRLRVGLQDAITLTSDPDYACDGTVPFVDGRQAVWQSGNFNLPAGDYREGYHLSFERTENDAHSDAVFRIDFQGVATSFSRVDTLPAGIVRRVIEGAETGTLTASDSMHPVILTITDLSGTATLNLNRNVGGSFVKVGANPTSVCELKIVYDQSGIAYDTLHMFEILHDNAGGIVADSVFLDFTHGAQVLPNQRVQLGDEHGVAYVAAQSGSCRDTAAYWAIPSTLTFRQDILGYFPQGNVLSDGNTVWYFGLYQTGQDSGQCGTFRVSRDSTNGAPLVVRTVYDCQATITATYDRVRHLVWVIQHSAGLDSAWGYDQQGILDTTLTAPSIPSGRLYQGSWIREAARTLLVRSVDFLNFTDSTLVAERDYPAELTEQFAGGAGIGFPGAGRLLSYSINTFDASGRWTGQFPVTVGPEDFISNVSMIFADSVIVYSISGNFADVGLVQQVRKLSPR